MNCCLPLSHESLEGKPQRHVFELGVDFEESEKRCTQYKIEENAVVIRRGCERVGSCKISLSSGSWTMIIAPLRLPRCSKP